MEPIKKVNEYPPDWWKRLSTIDFLIKEFRQYVIGLLISYSTDVKSHYKFYTGFLFEYKEYLLWVTAGHIIDQINENLLSGNRIQTMRWFDNYPNEDAGSIPINFRTMQTKSWNSLGLDAGAIIIKGLEKGNILTNKLVKPMNEQICDQIENAKPEGYYVVGFPRDFNNYEERPAKTNKVLKSLRADYAIIPLEKIPFQNNDPNKEFFNKPNAFYGQLIDEELDHINYVRDINYMSGSPIFTIERTHEEKLLYRVAGIQKKWLRGSRRICAEPITEVIKEIKSWL
jgi:hypothetical protein